MKKILVVGDLLIDRYLYCTPKGVSPEAPIISMNIDSIEEKIGGAGNVALNIAALLECYEEKADLSYIGPIPDRLWDLVNKEPNGNIFQFSAGSHKPAGIKNRIVYKEPFQQIIRFDNDRITKICKTEEKETIRRIELEGPFDIAVVSDYLHGFFTKKIFAAVLKHTKIILVDPKGKDAKKYAGATLITPNSTELENLTDEPNPARAARRLSVLVGDSASIVHKMGGRGCILYPLKEDVLNFKAKRFNRAVIDPTGAGDTFIGSLAFSIATKGYDLEKNILFATAWAGYSVCFPGCYIPRKKDLVEFPIRQLPRPKGRGL